MGAETSPSKGATSQRGSPAIRVAIDLQPAPESGGPSIEPLTVRIPVAVRLTGIGRSKLYELIQEGEIETIKIGSATLISVSSLKALLQKYRR
jgi:excisionase family DNA binding protein